MATGGEGDAAFLDRASRATRGKRMTKLLHEEIEEDEKFWNQDALKEEETDDSYEEEGEVADEFDSDFNDDEPEPDAEVENEVEERVKKRKLTFPGKQIPKKKKQKNAVPKPELPSEDEDPSPTEEPNEPEQQEVPDEAEGERIIRKSTRTAVIVRQAEREAIRAALQATMKPIKRKKEGEEKRMTQEEMLLEAAQTEIRNLRNLERVLAREEEVKKRAVIHKEVYTGPQLRYCSKDGKTFLEFSKGLSFESEIRTKPVPYPEKAVCVVTGLPAKYWDPKTGLPYATLDAFKIIRQRFQGEEAVRLKQENLDMGSLFALVSGQGFSCKRRRSRAVATLKRSCLPSRLHFQRISAPEIHDFD